VAVDGARVETGAGGLGEFFDPDGPPSRGSRFGGVVERVSTALLGLDWTPRDGVAAGVRWGYQVRHDADHVAGRDRQGWIARAALSARR
jgi:hypothetical protein